MERDPLKRHWDRARSLVRQKWDRLTESDVATIDGSTEALAGVLVERYGFARDRARDDARAFAQEFEQAGETATEPRASALRHPAPGGPAAAHADDGDATTGTVGSTLTNPLEHRGRPARGLDDATRDAFGGGSVPAADF